MWRYIGKRLLALIPVIIGVTFIVFMILNLAPGDPAISILGEQAPAEAVEQLREEMGLNDPLLVQYGRYMIKLVQGDMGMSYKSKTPVSKEIVARIPTTSIVAVTAIAIALIFAVPLGIIAAIKQNTWVDGVTMFVALLGVSMPIFWSGMILILIFSLKLGLLPVAGASSWKSFVLPSISLGFQAMASIARITRSSMLEVIRQDYIRTARAKGLPEKVVIGKHALKNALIPTVTSAGLQLGFLLSGAVLTETVFSLPGIGRFMIASVNARDIPAVMGCILFFTIVFTVVNLLVDILYGFLDPRIKAAYAQES